MGTELDLYQRFVLITDTIFENIPRCCWLCVLCSLEKNTQFVEVEIIRIVHETEGKFFIILGARF